MKRPPVLILLLPILLACIVFLRDYAVQIFIPFVFLLFLVEIKIRYGNLSLKNIRDFFNTPIKRYGLSGKEIIDPSPKFPFLLGILLMLVGAIVIMFISILVFAFFV